MSTRKKKKFCIIFSCKIITLISMHAISRKLIVLPHKVVFFFGSYLCYSLSQELYMTSISGSEELNFKVVIMAFKKREGDEPAGDAKYTLNNYL